MRYHGISLMHTYAVIKFETQAFHPQIVAWSLSPTLPVLLNSRRIWRAAWHNRAVSRILPWSHSSKDSSCTCDFVSLYDLYVSRCLCLSLQGWSNFLKWNFVFCREDMLQRKHAGRSNDPAVLKWLDAPWEHPNVWDIGWQWWHGHGLNWFETLMPLVKTKISAIAGQWGS